MHRHMCPLPRRTFRSMRRWLVESIRDPGIGVGVQQNVLRTSAPPDVHKTLDWTHGDRFQRVPQRQNHWLGICVLTSDPWVLHVFMRILEGQINTPLGQLQREPQRQHRLLGICVLTSDPWCLHVLYGFSRDR